MGYVAYKYSVSNTRVCTVCFEEKKLRYFTGDSSICKRCVPYEAERRTDTIKKAGAMAQQDNSWTKMPGYSMYLINEKGDVKGSTSGEQIGYSDEVFLMNDSKIKFIKDASYGVVMKVSVDMEKHGKLFKRAELQKIYKIKEKMEPLNMRNYGRKVQSGWWYNTGGK